MSNWAEKHLKIQVGSPNVMRRIRTNLGSDRRCAWIPVQRISTYKVQDIDLDDHGNWAFSNHIDFLNGIHSNTYTRTKRTTLEVISYHKAGSADDNKPCKRVIWRNSLMSGVLA